jgi:dipeptidase D
VQVNVAGLKGGHSGLEIDKGRGNAVKIMGRALTALGATGARLSAINGGNKHNAIPREAFATVLLSPAAKKKADKLLPKFRSELKVMYEKTDPGVKIDLAPAKAPDKPLLKTSRDVFLKLVLALPHGVLSMSQAIPGLVESSTNLAVVKLEKKGALMHESSRSSVMPALHRIQRSVVVLAELAGAKPVPKEGYPGWQPNMDSRVLARAKSVHERLTGKTPAVKAIHAGLECGIIGEKFGGMDMISFGPQIEWPHSPSERVHIASVERFFLFLKALLQDLAI